MGDGMHKKIHTILKLPELKEVICHQKSPKHALAVSRQSKSKSGSVTKANLRDLTAATGLVWIELHLFNDGTSFRTY